LKKNQEAKTQEAKEEYKNFKSEARLPTPNLPAARQAPDLPTLEGKQN